MSRQRPWLLSVLFVCLGASVGSAPLSAQGVVLPPPSIEFLDGRGADTSVVLANATWHVRVVDPERDYYSTPDIIALKTTSAATGDQEDFTLYETGPSTGVFEGLVESATGPSGFGNRIIETATGPAPDFTLDTVQIRHLRVDGTYLTATATVIPSLTTLVDDFGNKAGAYTVGHPVRVRVEDHNLDSPLVAGTATVQLTTSSGDLETLILVETGAATQIYEGSMESNTGPTFALPGDGAVQLIFQGEDQVTATHADANGGTVSTDVAGSTSATLFFIGEDGGPLTSLLEGSRVHLRLYDYTAVGGPPVQDYRVVTLQSSIGDDEQPVQLWETGLTTGVFEGWIPIAPTVDFGSYQLYVGRGPGNPPTYDTLTASFAAYEAPAATTTAQVTGFAEIAVIDEDGRQVEAVPVGRRLRVRVRNPGEKEAGFVLATVRSLSFNEREPVALFRTAAGSDVFEGSIPMLEGYPDDLNGTLEVYLGEMIEVEHVNAGATASVKATFVPTGVRIQFLDEDGEPTDRLLLGFPVRVRYFNQTPNLAFGDLHVQSEYPGSDAEPVTLTPTSQPGVSEGSVPMVLGPNAYFDGKLDVVEISDPPPARYNTVTASISCSGGFLVCPKAEAEIVPALVAFVDEQGHPMDAYAVGGRVDIRLTYKGTPTGVDQAQVVVRSLATGSEQTVTLTETGTDTNRFTGSVLTADADGPATSGRVRVRDGDTISVVYTAAGGNAGTASVDDTARIVTGTAELVDVDGNPVESYLIGSPMYVRAVEPAANSNPTAANALSVEIWTTRADGRTWDREALSLSETGPNTGVFTGMIEFPHGYPWSGDGLLHVYYSPYSWDGYFNPMTVAVSVPGYPDTVGDRAGTHPAVIEFVDAQGNPTDTLVLGGPVRLRVKDHQGEPYSVETIQVRLESVQTGDAVDLTLTESGPATGLYEALVPSAGGAAVSGDTTLQASSGEPVRASHLGPYGNTLIAVTSAIMGVNEPPAANPDQITIAEDSVPSVSLNVLANDSDPEGQPLQVTAIEYQTGSGAVTFTANGLLTLTPGLNYYGVVEVTYTVSDGVATANGLATFIVEPVLDGPVANPDTVTISEGGQIQISVRDNDQVGDTLGLSVRAVTNGAHGTAVNKGNLWVVYTQTDNDYHGTDTFTYILEDGAGLTAIGTVTVIIEPFDDPFLAQDDAAVTDEDVPVTIDVLANDIEVDDPKSVAAVTQAAHGTVVLNPNSTVTYTPHANYSGTDTFTYTGRGGAFDDEGLVTITIHPVNEPPAANDATFSVDENSANGTAVGTVVATDPEAPPQTLTYAITGGNPGGAFAIDASTGAITVANAAALDFETAPSFTLTVTVNDSGTPSLSDTATVTANVSNVNEAPTAAADSATTNEDAAVSISVLTNDTDPENDNLAVTAVTQGANGTVAFTGTSVTYTPAANFSGSDSFSYTLSDGNGGNATANVSITITGVNDSPVAVADSASTDEDAAVSISVLANDTDPENENLAVTAVTQGIKGSVTFTATGVTYTPAANANGSDSFTYTVSDGNGGTASGTVSVTISSVNDSPVAVADSAATTEDAFVTVSVLANDSDPDGQALAVTAVTQGTKGAVTFNAGSVTYTPAANTNGADSFTYTASDGNGGTATATVTVNVTPVNDAPDALNDAVATNEDTAAVIAVLANDLEVDGEGLQVIAVTQGTRGAVSINANGTVTYVPNTNASGADSFTYTVRDASGSTDTATVSVSVIAVNDAPNALADAAVTRENTAVTVTVLANDTDVEGNALDVTSVSAPAFGTAVGNPGNASITYTPSANFNGVVTFTYTVSDGQGGTATAMVTITVKDALERVAVLGANSVYVQTGADVLSGDVIANQSGAGPFLNGGVELSLAGTVTTAAGYDVQANRMTLASGAAVGGDAFYNTRTGAGSVAGSTASPLTLPIFPALPAFPTAAPGSTNINVSNNGTRTLAAGSYGDLVVGRKGVVTFTGGTYHFRSIRVDREARLVFNAASQVRVQQKLSTGILTDIGPAAGTAFGASSLIFYIGGANGTGGGLAETPKAVEIGADNALDANLYAPNGTIWLQDRTQARGSFLGKDVQVGVDAQVTLDSFHTGQ